MKRILTIIALTIGLFSQAQRLLTTPPSGGNKKAMVSERIGITDVTIHYDRPGVKGREGKIWGQLIQEGFTDQGFGSSKAAPWRAGANENTTIEFSTDVKIEGKDLPAGKYGFFIAYGKEESTLIFSKNNWSWGSFYYKPEEDALRIKIKPQPLEQSVEWLKYEFLNQQENKATIALLWEKISFPFTVEVDLNKTQVASYRKELVTEIGFTWQPWQTAAQWCADHNTNLEEALLWSDTSINENVLGNRNYQSLSTRALILEKLKRNKEADATMKEALQMANMNQVHNYARRLLMQKRTDEALALFKANFEKYPNTYTTTMGLARGYSAKKDFENALKYATQALSLVADNTNKQHVLRMIELLKEGKDIN